jgi:hypothetical protein
VALFMQGNLYLILRDFPVVQQPFAKAKTRALDFGFAHG